MPKVKISEYSATANSNTDVASINIDEGCAPSGINNAIRAVMGHLKDFQQGTNGDPFNGPVNGTLGATTASTANVTTLTTSSTVTHNGGTANGVAYLNGSKVLTTGSALVFDGSNLGLGVTPSAWNTGGKAIEIKNGGNGLYSTGTNTLYQLSNAFLNSAGDFKYSATNFATQYTQYNGTHSWHYAASGTAGNTITFTQAMTLDASGNLGIGTTSPAYKLDVARSGTGFTARIGNGTTATYFYNDSSSTYIGGDSSINNCMYIYPAANQIGWATTNGTTKMLLDASGNLLVGTTNADPTANRVNGTNINNAGAIYSRSSGWDVGLNTTSGNNIFFYTDNGSARVTAGFISSNGATTLYNAASDYRLKENIQPMTGALAKVIQLKPVTFDWKDEFAGTQKNSQGFIAHELAEVCSQAVTGEKDAIDANGNPKYQGIDTSVLVATLVASIQEQQALITQLTARITALEGT